MTEIDWPECYKCVADVWHYYHDNGTINDEQEPPPPMGHEAEDKENMEKYEAIRKRVIEGDLPSPISWDLAEVPRAGDPRFHAKLQEIADLHDKKQQDYGTDTDPFANVRGSQAWGVSPWLGAMIRANDKIKRLQTYAEKGELANEGVADAFMDLAVYALIGLVLWEEELEVRSSRD